jgi:hypothetical protein
VGAVGRLFNWHTFLDKPALQNGLTFLMPYREGEACAERSGAKEVSLARGARGAAGNGYVRRRLPVRPRIASNAYINETHFFSPLTKVKYSDDSTGKI